MKLQLAECSEFYKTSRTIPLLPNCSQDVGVVRGQYLELPRRASFIATQRAREVDDSLRISDYNASRFCEGQKAEDRSGSQKHSGELAGMLCDYSLFMVENPVFPENRHRYGGL